MPKIQLVKQYKSENLFYFKDKLVPWYYGKVDSDFNMKQQQTLKL